MGKPTISMTIGNGYVKLPECIWWWHYGAVCKVGTSKFHGLLQLLIITLLKCHKFQESALLQSQSSKNSLLTKSYPVVLVPRKLVMKLSPSHPPQSPTKLELVDGIYHILIINIHGPPGLPRRNSTWDEAGMGLSPSLFQPGTEMFQLPMLINRVFF